MRIMLTISAAFVLAIWMLASMYTDAPAAQPQIKYNFTGSSFAKPRPAPVARTPYRPAPAARAPYSRAAFAAPSRSGGYSSYSGSRIVEFSRALKPGSILIKTNERKLYYVLGDGKAIQYGIGVGREGFTWRGQKRISRKAEWPSWSPPATMIARERAKGIILPAYMPGGPSNPLGARALYLGGSLYRIHGTNQPSSIGQATSSGCIRMLNEEVVDLHDRVKIGALVIVE
jgi:lipoprotein-anchoring transpeptidase ErfK/SrfK